MCGGRESPTSETPPDGGERLRKAALLLAAVAASLLAAEAVIRLSGLAPDVAVIKRGRFRLSSNPLIGYVPTPVDEYKGASLDFYDYRESSNGLGYRDDEHSFEKPPGTFRIVVIGDSVGAGLLVPDRRDIFPEIIERRLNEAGIVTEIINLSVSGYNTQQEVETLRTRGLVYDPDLVLLAYCLNDRRYDGGGIMEALLQEQIGTRAIPASRVFSPLLINSALWRFIRFTVMSGRYRDTEEFLGDYVSLISKDTSEEYLNLLGSLSAEHGFEVVVAIFPVLDVLGKYPYTYEHDRLRRISSELGFHAVDLLDVFKDCSARGKAPVGADKLHPSALGHRCAADALTDFILLRIFGQIS